MIKKLINNISFSDWFMIGVIIFQLGMSFAKLSYIEQKLDAIAINMEKQIDYVQLKLDTHIANEILQKLERHN